MITEEMEYVSKITNTPNIPVSLRRRYDYIYDYFAKIEINLRDTIKSIQFLATTVNQPATWDKWVPPSYAINQPEQIAAKVDNFKIYEES